jgi:glycosyltransferase involved in cell wall biosynthesis
MLDAMASGLPVIVTAAGGMREYLVHGRTGFACADSQEFVHFIALLLDNSALLESMSALARGWAMAHFSLDALAERLRTLLLGAAA